MSKPVRTELMIPTWAYKSGYESFGDRDYGGTDSCRSAWLSLRNVNRADPHWYMNDDACAVQDVGIYVWMSDDSVSLDLRLHDVHSLTLAEAERRVKRLKGLRSKAAKGYPLFDCFVRDSDVHAELTKLIDALGIRSTVVYHGIGVDSTYEPIGIAIQRIAAVLQRSVDGLRQRKQA